MVRIALCCAALLLASAVRADEPDSLTRRERGDLALEARAILQKYCSECHGEKPARTQLSVLDYKSLTAAGVPVPFVSLVDGSRSQVMEFIEDGSMPPGGRSRPSPGEIDALKAWVNAKAPGYPRSFDDRTTLAVLLDDWAAQKAEDRPHLRYVSLAHLIRDGEPLPNLKSHELRLQQALLAASDRPAMPEPVDDAATLFRLDLRLLGWDSRDLFHRIEKGQPRPDVYPVVPFDLILLEYPASLVPAADAALKDYLAEVKQLRQVPFLRGDWLHEAIAPGSPLAADMKSLVALGSTLAKSPDVVVCGPKAQPFAIRQGVKKDKAPAVAAPLTAWYAGDAVPEPRPFDLKLSLVNSSAERIEPVVETGQPFRIEVSCDRDVRFLLLDVLSTGDIRVVPVNGGYVIKPGAPRILSTETGRPFVISSLLSGKDSETEHFIVIAAENDLPLPTIIRSRHSDGLDCRDKGLSPIWRFVFDVPADKFDSAKAVRKLLAVKVQQK